MKKYFWIFFAIALFATGFTFETAAQQLTKSGAPVIPLPQGDVRKSAPAPGSVPKIQIGKARMSRLANGLTVIVVENHKLPRVSFRVFVNNDPVLEKDAAGYGNMMGELLTKGTRTRTKTEIDNQVDFIGATLSSDASGVAGACLSKHTDELLGLMSDVVLNPVFPEEELEKDRRRQASNLIASRDDANAISRVISSILCYGEAHPYGEVMTEETLGNINLDLIKSYYDAYFKPDISYLVVVGDITPDVALIKAEKYFGAWPSGTPMQHRYAVPQPPGQTQVDFVDKPGAVQAVITITYPVALPPNSPDIIPSRLMNTLLGGYFNSRVNANLREAHGFTYGAFTALSADPLVGDFRASASVRTAVADSAIAEFLHEFRRLRTEKISNDELQLVKNVLTGQFAQSLEQPATLANFALNTARFDLPADYYEKYLIALQQVTTDDVLAMAQKYILPDQSYIIVIGNRNELAERLKPFTPDGQIHFFNRDGTPLVMTKVPVPAGVTASTVIADYVQAIGGMDSISHLHDLTQKMALDMSGMALTMTIIQKAGDKIALTMEMNGQTVSNRVFDGSTGNESGLGGATRALEGEELEDLKEQAWFCKESHYASAGYILTLKGGEVINGQNAYVLEVVRPDGKKTLEYYDMTTSLKMREISSQAGGNGQAITVTTDFGDYKAINGVLFPHSITISGASPAPLSATVTSATANSGVDDAIFQLK